MAVWAEQQLVVADQFRNGNVAGGEDSLTSVMRAFVNVPPWVVERRFRADSAAYYAPLLKYLVREQIDFAISADMTQELRACCTAVPPEEWALLDEREREQVDLAEVEFTINAMTFNVLTALKRRALPERFRGARPPARNARRQTSRIVHAASAQGTPASVRVHQAGRRRRGGP